jgi:predicted nuclease with TOPRIM domain
MREDFPFQKAEEAIVDMLHDYLAEKEHAERLESENSILMRKTSLLMDKVERLTKAGDEMDRALTTYAGNMKDNCFQCQLDWNAAKEGKPRA